MFKHIHVYFLLMQQFVVGIQEEANIMHAHHGPTLLDLVAFFYHQQANGERRGWITHGKFL
jgi:hypothetical protein